MSKHSLTDRTLKALKPAKSGQLYDLMDAEVPGFGVRVSDTGRRTFILIARYPGSNNPTRRALGEYAPLSSAELKEAERAHAALVASEPDLTFDQYLLRTYGPTTLAGGREKARRWKGLIARRIDPKDEEERHRAAEQRKRTNTFEAVAEDFIAEKLPSERKGKEVEADIRREFLPVWRTRPIVEITDLDVLGVIKAKAKTKPAQARNLLGHAKRLFSWAIDQRVYGLKTSPCESLKPTKIIGEKTSGERTLSDEELFALWRAAKRLPYPHGSIYRLLVLTALRLNEAADTSWSEFDLANRLWTIPAHRMKGKNGKARPHAVPLTNDVLAILERLPRFKTGDYLFSTTFGASPAWMSDKVKSRIDNRMLRTLRALTRRRGDDPSKVKLQHWTNHDIRRTVRSNLSRLRVTEEAREAVLAHVRPGIKGTYDHHDYLDEKREALTLWAARLRSIVEPAPENVIAMRGIAAR
jgi:integrase